MRIAIIGTRLHYPRTPGDDKREAYVCQFVRRLAKSTPETVIVSGGASGVDSWAAATARWEGLALAEHKPNYTPGQTRAESVKAIWERNRKIVNDSDMIVAIWDNKSSGTAGTIKIAESLGKSIISIVVD